MAADWRTLSKGHGMVVDETGISVGLAEGRSHRLTVVEDEGSIVLSAVVLGRAAMERMSVPAVRIWEMNRSLNLVGFRVDAKGRLIGESWIPRHGISPREFELIAKHLASECDRYEFMLTGRDIE